MSKATAKSEPQNGAHQQPTDAVFQAINETVNCYVAWATAWNREISDFAARRMSHQKTLVDQVRECEDTTAFAETQQSWLQQAQDDYSEEFKRLADLNFSYALNSTETDAKEKI